MRFLGLSGGERRKVDKPGQTQGGHGIRGDRTRRERSFKKKEGVTLGSGGEGGTLWGWCLQELTPRKPQLKKICLRLILNYQGFRRVESTQSGEKSVPSLLQRGSDNGGRHRREKYKQKLWESQRLL